MKNILLIVATFILSSNVFAKCTCFGVAYTFDTTPPTIYTWASEKPTCQEALSELSSKGCFSKITFHNDPDSNSSRAIDSVEAISPANCTSN